ncbi:hypothetical protein D3C71_1189990 [compost metagenome]
MLRFLRVAGEGAVQCFVDAEDEFHRMRQHERRAIADETHRHVGGQAQGELGQQPAHVIAAPGDFGNARAPVGQRSCPHADAWAAGQRTNAADQTRWAIQAAVALPARCEVDHFHFGTVGIAQYRAQDRGVGDVVLLAVGEIFQLDTKITAIVIAWREQRAEGGITIERRQATPDHPCAFVDQGAIAAIADDGQIKVGLVHVYLLVSSGMWRGSAQPRMHGCDIGQGITGVAVGARADQYAVAVQLFGDGEAVFVGEIVTDEYRAATGERRGFHQGKQGLALVVIGADEFDDVVARLQSNTGKARQLCTRECMNGGGCIGRVAPVQGERLALVFQQYTGMLMGQFFRPEMQLVQPVGGVGLRGFVGGATPQLGAVQAGGGQA